MFSAFKRMFGEHLYSLKWKNIVQEVRIKVATYNRVDWGQVVHKARGSKEQAQHTTKMARNGSGLRQGMAQGPWA